MTDTETTDDQEFDVNEDGKLVKNDDETADFEENLTMEQ